MYFCWFDCESCGENSIHQIPIYARAQDLMHLLDLKKAGATDAILENAEVLIEVFLFSLSYIGLVKCKLKALWYYGLGMLTKVITFLMQTSLQLGSKLLKGLGLMSDDVNFLSQLFRDSMELQAQDALSKSDDREYEIMKPLQVLLLISNVIIWSPIEH